MEKRKKLGWNATGIVGMVFAPIGLFFAVMGPVLYAMEAGGPGSDLVFLWTFGGIGLVFLLLGLGLLLPDVLRRRGQRRAIEQGETVRAKVLSVSPVLSVNYNGRHPYVVECSWQDPDTGEVHVWHSRYLRFDPEALLASGEVPVYVDRYEPKYAYVDVDAELPEVHVY